MRITLLLILFSQLFELPTASILSTNAPNAGYSQCLCNATSSVVASGAVSLTDTSTKITTSNITNTMASFTRNGTSAPTATTDSIPSYTPESAPVFCNGWAGGHGEGIFVENAVGAMEHFCTNKNGTELSNIPVYHEYFTRCIGFGFEDQEPCTASVGFSVKGLFCKDLRLGNGTVAAAADCRRNFKRIIHGCDTDGDHAYKKYGGTLNLANCTEWNITIAYKYTRDM